jgi:hypothetical protein
LSFLFKQFPTGKVDEAIVALVRILRFIFIRSFNPTFFKITGQRSGVPGKVDRDFLKGKVLLLYNVNGDYEPIKIIDSPSFGGVKTWILKLKKEENHILFLLMPEIMETYKVTLEIQKISPAS